MGTERSSLQRASEDADGPLESQPHVAFLVDGRWRPGVLLRELGTPGAAESCEVLTRDGPFGEAIEQHRGFFSRRSVGQTLRLTRRTVPTTELRRLDDHLPAIDATLVALRRYETHGLGHPAPETIELRQEADAAAARWQALYETGLPAPSTEPAGH
ncbi:MAG: hypothetical protein NVSMB29_19410 [Candidatus Dormibacteria bacterium]